MADRYRYLSIFIDRFIPSYIQTQYPLYKSFIEQFLGYLEQKDGLYDSMVNFIHYRDIDYIAELKNSSDPDQVELANQIIYEIYEEMLGSKDTRYLSSLLDEILFLKKQKGVLQRKGTKYSFLFLFLIILGGYFRILNVTTENKLHNGYWLYNGIITYDKSETAIENYIYLIVSEFYPTQYEKILYTINPAGIKPYYIVSQYFTFSGLLTGEDITTIYDKPKQYFVLYNGSTLVGMVRPVKKYYAEDVSGTTTFDIELPNSSTWIIYTSPPTGISNLYYQIVFNESMFSDLTFNRIQLVSNPTTQDEYYYNSTDADLTGAEILYDEIVSDTDLSIINNINTNFIITF